MKKVSKRKLFTTVGKITMLINIFVYLCSVWIEWDFYIPLKWIADIPTMDEGDRAGVLTGFLSYYGAVTVYTFMWLESSEN